jgi:hypothetical protein
MNWRGMEPTPPRTGLWAKSAFQQRRQWAFAGVPFGVWVYCIMVARECRSSVRVEYTMEKKHPIRTLSDERSGRIRTRRRVSGDRHICCCARFRLKHPLSLKRYPKLQNKDDVTATEYHSETRISSERYQKQRDLRRFKKRKRAAETIISVLRFETYQKTIRYQRCRMRFETMIACGYFFRVLEGIEDHLDLQYRDETWMTKCYLNDQNSPKFWGDLFSSFR